MAQIPYRANLSATVFPMTLAKSGRTVINPGYDQNFDKRVDSPGDNSKSSVGIPQVIYMENVFPTPDGFQSVGLDPQTSITIPTSEDITCVIPIKLGTVSNTTEIVEDIDITDTGDTIENWTKSTFFNGQLANPYDSGTYPSLGDSDTGSIEADSTWYTEVAESSGIGDSVNSYRLAHLEYYDGTASPPHLIYPAYLLRDANIGLSNNITVDWRTYFKKGQIYNRISTLDETFTGTKHMNVVVANTATGAGIRIVFTSTTGKLQVCTTVGGTVSTLDGPVGPWDSRNLSVVTQIDLTVAYDTWYRFECTVVRNEDSSRTVTVLAKDNTGTLITTLVALVNSSIPQGGFVGFIHANDTYDSSTGYGGFDITVPAITDYAVAPDKVFYDTINITGDVADQEFQVTSGITQIHFSFFTNNTVKASDDLTSWDNTSVTVPGSFESPSEESKISVALVRSVAYVCIKEADSSTKIYTVTSPSSVLTFTDITSTISAGLLEGYTINDVVGIVSSYNYLILITPGRVFWSSTISATDFSASLITGAGSDIPNNLKGDMKFAKDHVAGFYIYTTGNAVFAQYTGNSRYPWKFREIGGSGGYFKSTQVSGDTNTLAQIGITTAKNIQSLGTDSSEIISPEVTDYLERGNTYDSFNYSTNVFTLNYLSKLGFSSLEGDTRVWFVLDRYVFIPYPLSVTNDITTYSYCLMYDLVLKRYGKIKTVFSQILNDEESIYFVDYTAGAIKKLEFDIHSTNLDTLHSGVLVLGKFQLSRDKLLQLEEIEIECSQSTNILEASPTEFSLAVLPSLDGKNFTTPITPTVVSASQELLKKYLLHNTAKNFCLCIKGAFDVNTVQMLVVQHGKY